MVKILPAIKIAAGQEPAEDHADVTGAKALRGWQARGLRALRSKALSILLAPTGSGKSTLLKALALTAMRRDPSLKVIIAVPQMLIARSFAQDDLLIDGKPARWHVAEQHRLIGTNDNVTRLVDFLKSGDGRTLICTHQTLVLAHQKLMNEGGAWPNVALYIDEAHHSSADESDRATHNRLGQLVAHWMEAKPGPLLLATATWMRANMLDIVPKSRAGEFTRFILTMEEHLAAMRWLREVSFRFLIGDVDECLRAVYSEGNAKTIAWLPPVGSALTRESGGKASALSKYQRALGSLVRYDEWTDAIRHDAENGLIFNIRSLDFVTQKGRDERKLNLEKAIESGTLPVRKAVLKLTGRRTSSAQLRRAVLSASVLTPSLLWALNMGKEGFDWPELQRAIVIGERASIPDVLQMLGRVLRDYPLKRTAEFNVILPYSGEVDSGLLKSYVKTVLMSMVVEWQLRMPRIRPAAKPDDERIASDLAMDDPEKAAEVIGNIVDAVVTGGDADPDEIIRGAIEAAELDASDEDVERVRELFSERTKAMLRDVGDVSVNLDAHERVFGCIRMVGMSFGYGTLSELRKAMGAREAWVSEEVLRERIRGMTVKEYMSQRTSWPGFPAQEGFVRVYGKTFLEISAGARRGNLAGQVFGRFTVAGEVVSSNGLKFWRCQCACGEVRLVRADSLKSGRSKSCGCLKRENASTSGRIAGAASADARRTYMLDNGQMASVADMARMSGLSMGAIVARMSRGLTPQQAVDTPSRRFA